MENPAPLYTDGYGLSAGWFFCIYNRFVIYFRVMRSLKTLLNPWFLLGCGVWLINTMLRRFNHPLPYLNGYLTDAFAIPVIANLGLCYQRLVYKNPRYVLKKGHVVFVVLYVSLVFEWLLPHYSKKYTGDWADVLLYAAGGIFFYLVMNKSGLKAESYKPKKAKSRKL
jgi:hypothetical protein